MRTDLPTLITVCLVPDELLTRLLVVAEAEHIDATVAARLPCTRLPVLLVIGAPDAALAQVATAATGIAPLTKEAASGTARLAVVRDSWAAAATGVLSVLLLLCLRASPLVYRAIEGVQRIQLPVSQPLPVRLLIHSHLGAKAPVDRSDLADELLCHFGGYYLLSPPTSSILP
jgi:hypothetical protein